MSKSIIINPSQAILLYEMAYPTTFHFEEFSKITNIKDRLKYCSTRLKRIGSGSSRTVFAVDNEKALKIAKNRKGLAQNEMELDNGLNNYNVSPKVYNFDNINYTWIEVQIARKAKPEDFKNLTGYDMQTVFNSFYEVDRMGNPSRYRYYSKEHFVPDDVMKRLWEDDNIYPFLVYISDYQPPINDLTVLHNWGVVSDNGKERLVIVDTGLSDEIWNNYYSKGGF